MFDNLDEIVSGLQRLHVRRHDVVILQILDRAELEFPFEAMTRFQGVEVAQESTIDARAFRQSYLEEIQAFNHQLEEECRRLSIKFVTARTDEPIDRVMMRQSRL